VNTNPNRYKPGGSCLYIPAARVISILFAEVSIDSDLEFLSDE
jgi:hypothetical protein